MEPLSSRGQPLSYVGKVVLKDGNFLISVSMKSIEDLRRRKGVVGKWRRRR